MLFTVARFPFTALHLFAIVAFGGFTRVGRHEVYSGCGAMLPDQPPLWPRWYREERTVVVRLGGRVVMVSRLA
jgi:hypothetical protein